jgi:hypothetical protein
MRFRRALAYPAPDWTAANRLVLPPGRRVTVKVAGTAVIESVSSPFTYRLQVSPTNDSIGSIAMPPGLPGRSPHHDDARDGPAPHPLGACLR